MKIGTFPDLLATQISEKRSSVFSMGSALLGFWGAGEGCVIGATIQFDMQIILYMCILFIRRRCKAASIAYHGFAARLVD